MADETIPDIITDPSGFDADGEFWLKAAQAAIRRTCGWQRTASHNGHDWAVNTGTKVRAAAEGVVELAYFSESYGYNILINHNNGFKTRYAHLSEVKVSKGEKVEQSQVIALSGSTGFSTGPHLHFEVVKDGKRVNPIEYVSNR